MAATKANTPPVFTRNGNVITASWKIQTTATPYKQQYDYRILKYGVWGSWGGWKEMGATCTWVTLTWPDMAGSVQAVEFKTKIKGINRSGVIKDWSSPVSSIYYTYPPNTPTLSMTKNSANSTTFSWNLDVDTTGQQPFYTCYYYTRLNGVDSGWIPCAASGSITYTDTGANNVYRSFYVYARGWGGDSSVAKAHHFIGPPPAATWQNPPASLSDRGSYYNMTYNAVLTAYEDQVDGITPQYYIGLPTANMGCPGGASWNDGVTRSHSYGTVAHALPITTNDVIDEDECLWARIKTEHDGIPTYSSIQRIKTGRLKKPTANIVMGSITASGFEVDIDITNAGTGVPGAYVVVYLERRSRTGRYERIGTIPNGTSRATITSNIDLTGENGLSIHLQNVTADGYTMKSEYYTYSTSMPASPVLNSVTQDIRVTDKVYVSWTRRWNKSNGTIIAWTDDPDNWMSNDEPDTYEVTENASGWYITGLTTGKTWYFRVRSVLRENDAVTYSPWSNEIEVDLSSDPAVPVLYLSDEVITKDGMVSAYWIYATTDGTPQIAGDIEEMVLSNGEWIPNGIVAAVSTAQHVDIYAEDQGWENGDIVYLSLRTRSGSGGQSEYSTPVRLAIAELPTVAITASDIVTGDTTANAFLGDGETTEFTCSYNISSMPSVTVDGEPEAVTYSGSVITFSTAPENGAEIFVTYETEDYKTLTALPLDVAVQASATELTLAIERAANYPMSRPDGTETTGAKGETIYLRTIKASAANAFSISLGDLIGRLDDRAQYTLVATATDDYGQKAEATIDFTVHWSRQAWMPTADIIADRSNRIVRITPIAGEDYEEGDTCEIYRMSIDGPELIIAGADFGTEYVDPYPAFGPQSGYKVVTITENGDYITEDNRFAQYDTTEDGDYTPLDEKMMIIDFGSASIDLPYNISLSNVWNKDFKRTVYLGGNTAGDHNKAVTRDLTASTVLLRDLGADAIPAMRELARYAGTCHVRTPDGSSFAADVQVSEGMAYSNGTADYSLKIQQVDPVGYEGMTYAEWSEMQ